jgi:uncharacterized protein YqeY
MTLEKLQSEMIQAMKNGDKFRKGVIADLVSNVKKAAIDKKCKDNIPEALVDEVLLKCKKTTQEMIDTCPAERVETLAEYVKQLDIINEFAPVLITDEAEIKSKINELLIENHIYPFKQNKGAIMKTIAPVFKGRVDMSVVSKVVGDILE